MPNRILKESICASDNLDKLTPFQETFFYRLIVSCDDYGRFDGRWQILKARLFPLKTELKANQVEDALQALVGAELIILYEVNGRPYLQLRTWDTHQSVRAKMSKYPDPTEGEIICKQLQADASKCTQAEADASKCSRNPIQSNPNPIRNPNTDSTRKRFTKPTLEDVRSYCIECNYMIDAERFIDYYESNGWMVGRNPMKDWKAAVRTWAKNDYRKGGVSNAVSEQPASEDEDIFAGFTAEQMAEIDRLANDGEHYG